MIFDVENVSAMPNDLVEGRDKARRARVQVYIAGKSPGGNTLHTHRTIFSNLQVFNITAAAFTSMSSTPEGGTIRSFAIFPSHLLAASDSKGDLHAFHKQPFFPWQRSNLSTQAGSQVGGAVTWWQERSGVFPTNFLGGVGIQGDVLVLRRGFLLHC